MLKQFSTIFVFTVLLSSIAYSQGWENKGIFPPISSVTDTVKGATHGIAVDPDGKIWITNHYADDTLSDGTKVHSIKIFNPDGTPDAFSPIKTITVNMVTDTLISAANHRGLTKDNNGNILLVRSTPYDMFRINYKTGEGMNKTSLTALGTSPTKPAVSENGTIFVGPVVGNRGNPIIMFDKDFTFLGNAIDQAPGIARTMEVSKDGNTIYWPSFTDQVMTIYHRLDEFSNFDSVNVVLKGLSVEASSWHPKTGLLWVTSNSKGFNNGYADTVTSWSPWTAYAYNTTTNEVVDSLQWILKLDALGDTISQKFRAIAFSVGGDTAYFGCFETNALPMAEWAVAKPTKVERENDQIVTDYILSQNYPNPFNPSTEIKFSIAKSGFVTLKVYDMLGREVAALVNENMDNGNYTVNFDASNLASGTYIYQLNANGVRLSKKMTLLK